MARPGSLARASVEPAPAAVAPEAARPAGAEVVVEHVARTYDGRVTALADVSLRLTPGEFVALTGPSGSGKSTLLQLIGGLDQPDSGRVLVDGAVVSGLERPWEYRRDVVGFVFQMHHLLPVLTAEHNVEVPLIAAGLGRADRRRRALELLAEVGLADRAEHLPSQLSGGERQRVAIARALANRPRLLLADEPTGALDTASARRVLELLGTIRERYGMTMLIVSYDTALAQRADRLVRIVDGQLGSEHARE